MLITLQNLIIKNIIIKPLVKKESVCFKKIAPWQKEQFLCLCKTDKSAPVKTSDGCALLVAPNNS